MKNERLEKRRRRSGNAEEGVLIAKVSFSNALHPQTTEESNPEVTQAVPSIHFSRECSLVPLEHELDTFIKDTLRLIEVFR